jgi:hypothetical protein
MTLSLNRNIVSAEQEKVSVEVESSKGGQTIPVGRIKGSADSNKVLLNKIEFSRKNRTPDKVALA